MNKKHVLINILLLTALSLATRICFADKNREYTLKAAFMINFARYTPQLMDKTSTSELIICSSDEKFITANHSSLKNNNTHIVPIVIPTFENQYDYTKEIKKCHIIFISKPQTAYWLEHLKDYTPDSQYIIGETKDFLEHTGHIRFFVSGGKIRFEISTDRLKKSGLDLSSKVLRMGLITKHKKQS